MIRTRMQQHNDGPLPERLHPGIILFDRTQSVDSAVETARLIVAELDAVDFTGTYDFARSRRRSRWFSN